MIYESAQWIGDLDETLQAMPQLAALKGHAVLITGAGGLICSAAADLLLRYNETCCAPQEYVKVYAAGRSEKRMRDRFGELLDRPYFRFLSYDASAGGNSFPDDTDFIIHGAGNANPGLYAKEPVQTMLGNIRGMQELLEYARTRGRGRVLYISSSEVYGLRADGAPAVPFREDEYGFVDILNPRNCYAASKRAAETLCASYAAQYGVEAVIVRPGHIYGPTASLSDSRVSSAWAYKAAEGEDIVMKSAGTQIRSYCYCLDCASAIFKVLTDGETARAYNISNPDSIVSIREMGELLAEYGQVKMVREEANEAEKKNFNPMDNSSLDSTALMELGWRGLFSARKGFAHTVEILRSMKQVNDKKRLQR